MIKNNEYNHSNKKPNKVHNKKKYQKTEEKGNGK